MISEPDHGAYRTRYEAIWSGARAIVSSGAVHVDPLPEPGQPRWGVSAVLRPDLPDAVWRRLDRLVELLGPGHAVYDPSGVHVTLRSLESYRSHVPVDDDLVRAYASVLASLRAPGGPLRVRFRGIVGTPTGVILCGYPQFDLVSLRRRYFAELAERGLTESGPETRLDGLRDSCHASLVVFGGPLRHPAAAFALLEDARFEDFGVVACDRIEIVRYARDRHTVETHVLATVSDGRC